MDENVHKGHRGRIRERYILEGLDGFADHQVLEFLLFYCYPRRDTNELAHSMLSEFGSLVNLFEAHPLEISERCGVSENVAALLSLIPSLSRRYLSARWTGRTSLDTPKKAGGYACSLFTGLNVEYFYVFCLDSKRALINAAKVFEGTVNEAAIYPREIVATAIKHKALAVILAHNHPSGVLAPSRNDIEATKRIIKALETVNVSVIDHIITAGDSYFSFSEKRTLPLFY
ncbi:MAG: DNA repair protein RadC [Clostridiales bacterium]|jgi:DNA repair protein RadC|nr:DNA repair protein RadC [Clostridiales bacterium]